MGFISGTPSKQSSTNTSSSSSTSGNQSYGILSNALAPTLGYGAQAGNMMGALLGLPSSSPATPAPSASVNPSVPQYNPVPSYSAQPSYGQPSYGRYGGQTGYPRMNRGYDNQNDSEGGIPYQYGTPPETYPQQGYQTAPVASQTPMPVSPSGAGSALENFSNSAGMDFLRDQGVKAIDASQAGKKMLQSGATGQALTSFGQNLSKTYLNDYLTHLSDYAGLGTKNAAILSSAGNTSTSTGVGSGTSSGRGAKNGLVQDVSALLGSAGGGSGVASMIPFL